MQYFEILKKKQWYHMVAFEIAASFTPPPSLDYWLIGRPQYERLQSCVGHLREPFFLPSSSPFIPQTSAVSQSCHLHKFSDDWVMIGGLSWGDDWKFRDVINAFVTWSELNHLHLNVTKTRELVVDLKSIKSPVVLVSIHEVNVDSLDNYKHLGVHIDEKLDWTWNTEAV